MSTKEQQARAFALAVAAIRSDAETLDDAPLYCDMADRKTYRYVDHLPRREYRLPAPGNSRGIIVSAPAARDSLNALADRLEKGARAFGGTPPRRDRSPLNTRGIVAARNAHAEGHHNAAHRALGDRLFIAASGHPFAVVSQMQAAGHDILLCRSIAARSNTIIAFCARSGVRLATAGNSSAPADFNEFCAWLDSKSAIYSGKLESMASLDQAAAVADYLDGDTVEAIDPEAEPCDTAAAVARAEASAKPEPEPEPEPVPVPVPGDAARPAKAGDTAGEKLANPQADDAESAPETSVTRWRESVADLKGKQPWEMTQGEWARARSLIDREVASEEGVNMAGVRRAIAEFFEFFGFTHAPNGNARHDLAVFKALEAGHPVPESVRAEYRGNNRYMNDSAEKSRRFQELLGNSQPEDTPIRAAEVKVKMPSAPPEDETQAASRSKPWAGETSRRRQSRRYTMRRRKTLCPPLRRSMPLRTRRRCARRRHVPPRNARADDAPH